MFTVHFRWQAINITLDSGATVAIIKEEFARRIGITFCKSKMKAVQADGCTKLNVVGECHENFERGKVTLTFNAIIVDELTVPVLGGEGGNHRG